MLQEQNGGHCFYCGQSNLSVVLSPCGNKCAFCKECINEYWKAHYKSGDALNKATPGCGCGKKRLIYDDWKDYFDEELQSLAARWAARAGEEEYQTSLADRVYCAKPTCSKFFNLKTVAVKNDAQTVYCDSCSSTTCLTCIQLIDGTHESGCKSRNVGLGEVLKEEDTQECPRCHTVITKTTGCVDMECVCGCMFCLECGEEGLGCGCQYESDSDDEDLFDGDAVEG
jgi:hypothetical protein